MSTKLFAAGLLATVFAFPAAAATIEVKPGESIQAKLNSAQPGDTVAVRAGTYNESVMFRGSGGRSGAPIRLVSVDGIGKAVIRSSGTPLAVLGGRYKEVEGFGLEAGADGNGMQLGGTVGDFASNYVVTNNVILNAGKDGIKVHQLDNSAIANNEVVNAGTKLGNSNLDGGIDFVAVRGVELVGNKVHKSGGNTCLMLKGGSRDNHVSGNDLRGCKNAVHVGGLTGREWMAPDAGGREAYNNEITGNLLRSRECAFHVFDGEKRRRDNKISGNNVGQNGGCDGEDNARVDVADAGVGGDADYSGYANGNGGGGGDSSEANRLLQAASSAMSAACGSKWSAGMTGISAASGIFSGGRATLAAQLAQQIQLVFQSGCAAEQLAAQIKAIAGYKINSIDDVENVMIGVQRVLGNAQRVTYDLAKSDNEWVRVFMETNGLSQMPFELATPAIGKRYAEMREYASDAMQEAARVRALAVTNMKAGNTRTRKAMNASAAAVGPTQAVQAGNLLVLEARQELHGMHQTMVSYNEAQSRIEQSKAVETVLAGVFMDKNMQSMNAEQIPEQGAVRLEQPQASSGFDFTHTTSVSAGSLSN